MDIRETNSAKETKIRFLEEKRVNKIEILIIKE